MPKYVIERALPGAGTLGEKELREVAQRSCDVLRDLGPDIQWLESFVTDDKVTCVYIAKDEALIREHAKRGDFPVTSVMRVRATIDPSTAEAR
jgi:hypothetical protein